MTEYANVLSITIPIFLFLMFLEWMWSIFRGKKVMFAFDTISSVSSGISNVIKDILGLAVIIVSYRWMFDNLALGSFKSTGLLYFIAFVVLDFAGYWSHRFEHTINIFWNRHIIHHSSEEFNLACALRQNISVFFALFTFLLLPAAILGVPPEIIGIVAPLHLFAQFWYHTRLIDKMGFLEKIIVTPSHHRVHHAINDIYLDKNYGQIFIIWDKMFGTFQEELDNVKPVYGVKRPVRTWNPVLINFQHLWLMVKDAWYAKHWVDKARIWFMPTGWRPEDVSKKMPLYTVDDPYNLEKYNTGLSALSVSWSWVQLAATLGFLLHFMGGVGTYAVDELLVYGVFLITGIYGYTSFMDGNRQFLITGILQASLVAHRMSLFDTWFGLPHSLMLGFIGTTMIIFSFLWYREKETKKVSV
ncbi:MAG: sterol desaturase family protein [Saprospiraceae bacterium]|nr:sterol desaturase family protein [Saprospiraceae bacterium]